MTLLVLVVSLLASGVFGHSFSSFANCVFRQFTGKNEPDGCLDLARADSRLPVVLSQAGSFASDALKDERVHYAHGFAGDTSVRVGELLQHYRSRKHSSPFSSLASSFHHSQP